MSGSGREVLPDARAWSGGPPGFPTVAERPSRIFGSGRDDLPVVQEITGGPSRLSGCGWEALKDVR